MEIEQALRQIIEGVSQTHGEQYFRRIIRHLGQVVDADIAFIARVDPGWSTSRTIALYANGELEENIEYPLRDTPCEQVLGGNVCVYPASVVSLFPDDLLLAEMNIEGYVGTALTDSKGNTLGLLVALYKDIVTNTEFVRTIIQLFAGRIGAEIERHEQSQDLERINNELEKRVAERTRELTLALNDLKRSKEQIAEQEKFASLGNLVAGITQEINTPLGIGVTSISHINETLHQLHSEVAAEKLAPHQLLKQLEELEASGAILEENLGRAAKLLRGFKQVAVDRSSSELSAIQLSEMVESLLISLLPESKKYPVSINNTIPPGLTLHSYPGELIQVLTNLLLNSLQHGYPNKEAGRVVIAASQDGDTTTITVSDDGVGIPIADRDKIFRPFFTTRRGQGSSGLGLNIVSNIVERKLVGRVELDSPEGGGSRFVITLPSHPEAASSRNIV